MDELQNNPTVDKKSHNEKNSKKLTPFARNLLISGIMLAVAVVLLVCWFIFRPDNKTNQHNLFNIEMISELTTLECRYHNVAVRDVEGGFMGIGQQYVWFEYDVIVDVGIDINEVKIENPTDDGVVRIYLPPAEILGAAEDKATISKPVCSLGAFTELTAEDERQIINEGVQRLKNDAKTQEVVDQAYISAKNVLEQYVINMGKLIGEDYTVEWVKIPDNSTITDVQVSTTTE